ncbi:hypothetical protein MMC21_003613 [Puttea exsequens]|nr:hypothetical protein [Puttea exsequens]
MASAPPFGLILPSRPVLTNPAVISLTQFAFTFPASPTFSHIIVFLFPGTPLPEGTLAGVYVQLPGEAGFNFLGAIGAEKQTAIFRVSSGGVATNGSIKSDGFAEDEMIDVDAASPTVNDDAANRGNITVGISIEPIATVTTQIENLKTSQSKALIRTKPSGQSTPSLSTKVLAQRIIKNAFNFLASFAANTGAGSEEVVPMKAFQDWWAKFERRIEIDPGFLERNVDS